ncbi:hypothetical protein [Flavobacterium sp.]|uniref:hypothetical protein n=1 Tax=Flavobacterium sp. TaxID=239 RepID=UPI00263A0E08|nr:hypothetical protein [Flavobacterium sp.]
MKKTLTYLLLFITSTSSFSQEVELENFRKELDFFIEYCLGKVPSMPQNEANHNKLVKKIDDAFALFITHSESQNSPNFKTALNDSNVKFSNIDSRIYVCIETFTAKNASYTVYSYSSGFRKAYFVKNNNSNTIVYKGKPGMMYIDNIFEIDDKNILLIEKSGDRQTSKKAMVFSSAQPTWKLIEAFKGKAFGQVNADYFNKKFVNKRPFLLLECEFEDLMSAPKEANEIYFDENTKTISYKIFENNYKFKVISSKWDNNMFTIDDYDVGENFSGSVPVMER